ncbi:uncharacterized protein [Mytilus edulis]
MDDYCEVIQFLTDRHASDESIQKIREEKVDPQTLLDMTDTDLHKFLMISYGDIHAAKRHFKTKVQNVKKNQRTEGLFHKFRKKMGRKVKHDKSSDSDHNVSEEDSKCSYEKKNKRKKKEKNAHEEDTRPTNRSEKLKGKNNAKKHERKIEIGWFDYDYRSSEYRQVRTPNGGGARYINAPKTWRQDDILQHGKKVFFLNGKSKRGKVTEFQYEVRNFMGDRMDNDCTIADLYTLTGSKLLRFYIYSKKLPTTAVGCSEMESPSDDSLPDPKLLQVNKHVSTAAAGKGANLSSDKFNPSNDSPSETSSLTPQTVQLRVNEDDTFVISGQPSGNNMMLVALNPYVDIVPHDISVDSYNETLPLNLPVSPIENDDESSNDSVQNLFNFVEDRVETPSQLIPSNEPQDLIISLNEPPLQQPIPNEPLVVPNILLYSDEEHTKIVIKIHKSNTFCELIDLFRDKTLDLGQCEVIRIMDNGKEEAGEGIGILRDIFTDFWDTFYLRCCEGNSTKVPILRHDMQREHWESVASIICNGLQFGYFPIKISLAIFEDAMYGKTEVDLVETFLQYIPYPDKVTIQYALEGFNVEIGELIDVLEVYNCKKYPNAENIKRLIEEIAHKEILQEPKFVIECWKDIFRNKLSVNRKELVQLYENKNPTVAKVLKLLKFPDVLELKEQIVAGYLKKFIKSLDEKGLQNFMRFCTGSNLMCYQLNVAFSMLSGFERRPTAQTCGNMLQLPSCYESVADLREDFMNIFKTNMWEMDYV